MTEQSISQQGICSLVIAAPPVIFGNTDGETHLRKWKAKILETRAGSERTTAVAGPRYG